MTTSDTTASQTAPHHDGESAENLGRRPDDASDATIEAVDAVSEALEWVEHARGESYSFHQMMGRTDLLLGQACEKLRDAGHPAVADRLQTEKLGRNVIHGRWTFKMVKDFDDDYWSVFREHDQRLRQELQQGRRHVLEAMMKEDHRTYGHAGHEARPTRQP